MSTGALPAPTPIAGVPEGYSCVILLPLGYPDEEPEARQKKDISEIVFKNKFGKQRKRLQQKPPLSL
jgi:hypothetical protein